VTERKVPKTAAERARDYRRRQRGEPVDKPVTRDELRDELRHFRDELRDELTAKMSDFAQVLLREFNPPLPFREGGGVETVSRENVTSRVTSREPSREPHPAHPNGERRTYDGRTYDAQAVAECGLCDANGFVAVDDLTGAPTVRTCDHMRRTGPRADLA